MDPESYAAGRRDADRVRILVVDDTPEKLVAYEALLAELGEEVVAVTSAREALRQLLHREFAVILLDVNMPGIDGFEAASLIRQRKATEHTPIIFVTGYADETHTARGYSLGAVDYIITPVDPEVMRTKVSVFVELFRKTEQVRRQAAALRRRNEQLHRLAEVSLAVNAAQSVDEIFDRVAAAARELTGALSAVAVTELDPERGAVACSVGDELLARAPEVVAQARALSQALAGARGVQHLTAAALASEPAWMAVRKAADLESPSGWLSAALVGREGRSMGWVHVAHRERGGFGGGDQAALQQLAQVASIAVENTLFAEARESNRLKDEFLTVLSHELRTPLTAIVGWTSILRTSPYDAARFQRGLEIIERNVAAQTKLIDDLLDISRIIAGKLRLSLGAVEIASLAGGVVDAMRPAAEGKGLELRLDIAPEARGLALAGDAERLEQVIWNLLSNAIKFTPSGGRVAILLGGDGESVDLEVRDTGRGIDAAFIDHVFERFRQQETPTTRSHGGLGLGLAIVRHLVEQHGGKVWADSAGLGKGASFHVRLPVTAPPAAGMPGAVPRRAPSATTTLTGRQVLLVDDDRDTRDLVVEVLAGAGATVAPAASVAEAKEILGRSRFDLVVSDIAMPIEDGFALVRWLREQHAHRRLPALALSAYARQEDRQRALKSGFDGYLAKPVAPIELLAAAAAALAPPRGAARSSRQTSNGRNVLLVENDAAAREALTALLERRGHRVTAAESGLEGVEKAAALRPDVAIVDLGLPDLDGLEVARRLRAGPIPAATLVAVTGRTVEADVAAALAAGFDAHLAKPLDLERLYALIDTPGPQAPDPTAAQPEVTG